MLDHEYLIVTNYNCLQTWHLFPFALAHLLLVQPRMAVNGLCEQIERMLGAAIRQQIIGADGLLVNPFNPRPESVDSYALIAPAVIPVSTVNGL